MTQLSRTNCEEAFRLLDDYLDRRLTPEEAKIIEEHLEICAWCAREFNYETSVLHGLVAVWLHRTSSIVSGGDQS